jgi:hypothetical protein
MTGRELLSTYHRGDPCLRSGSQPWRGPAQGTTALIVDTRNPVSARPERPKAKPAGRVPPPLPRTSTTPGCIVHCTSTPAFRAALSSGNQNAHACIQKGK